MSEVSEEIDEVEAIDDPTDLRFVGPATATALESSKIDAVGIATKRVSYTELVDAGVNPGVAARIRREHSLSWSFESSGEDLARRSSQIRGLDAAERAWVAASAGDWREDDDASTASEPAETDGSGDPAAAEATWRERSKPTPTSALDEVGDDDATRLSEAGITSIRGLATADPERVADVLELDGTTVRTWHAAARERYD
ncbi:DUF7409 domain-containing protein [Halegenticoccus tardaugens]|uniref:DUF7409 domain-containing protein n=1 Tax=Halegenticoccus tardaugens TaxID=2071624 RepID=UPI00100C0349|nr:helix-hairpin-helix domain-containing protein [Halegenticoccus tardaugens]